MVYPVLTNEEMTTESQRYKGFTRNGGNAIHKHAGPEAKGSNPTAGLTLLWAHNTFWGNFNHWQVSLKEAGQQQQLLIPNGKFIVLLTVMFVSSNIQTELLVQL